MDRYQLPLPVTWPLLLQTKKRPPRRKIAIFVTLSFFSSSKPYTNFSWEANNQGNSRMETSRRHNGHKTDFISDFLLYHLRFLNDHKWFNRPITHLFIHLFSPLAPFRSMGELICLISQYVWRWGNIVCVFPNRVMYHHHHTINAATAEIFSYHTFIVTPKLCNYFENWMASEFRHRTT